MTPDRLWEVLVAAARGVFPPPDGRVDLVAPAHAVRGLGRSLAAAGRGYEPVCSEVLLTPASG